MNPHTLDCINWIDLLVFGLFSHSIFRKYYKAFYYGSRIKLSSCNAIAMIYRMPTGGQADRRNAANFALADKNGRLSGMKLRS